LLQTVLALFFLLANKFIFWFYGPFCPSLLLRIPTELAKEKGMVPAL
jgi:hypothetical protein